MSLKNISMILADAAPAMQPNPKAQMFQTVLLMLMMGVIFYVVMIRPQSKKAKEHAALLKMVKPGDKVVTSGGVLGTVVSVKEKTIAIRSAETKLEVLKSAI